jgi:hypothetical protein
VRVRAKILSAIGVALQEVYAHLLIKSVDKIKKQFDIVNEEKKEILKRSYDFRNYYNSFSLNQIKNTNVYAALVSIINSKLPQIGILICKRVISLYRESFINDERQKTFQMIKFLGCLLNCGQKSNQLV